MNELTYICNINHVVLLRFLDNYCILALYILCRIGTDLCFLNVLSVILYSFFKYLICVHKNKLHPSEITLNKRAYAVCKSVCNLVYSK